MLQAQNKMIRPCLSSHPLHICLFQEEDLDFVLV